DAWIRAAEEGAAFVLSEMRRDGRLLRVWTAGRAHVGGFLEDYASVGNALLSLHEVTLAHRWLAEAHALAERILDGFWDDAQGRFHDTAVDAEPLVVRPRDSMDNATPAGGSLAAELLERLGHLQGESRFLEVAARTVDGEADAAARYPLAFGRLLSVAS